MVSPTSPTALLNAVLTELTGLPLYSTKCFASINPVPAPQMTKQAEGNRDRRLPLVGFRAALFQTVGAAALYLGVEAGIGCNFRLRTICHRRSSDL